MVKLKTESVEETQNLGERIGKNLQPGDVICLVGELGSGKTALAQGIARGLGVKDYITSPTFNIIKEYMGRYPLYHMDVYRLGGVHEMDDLGYEEYFYSNGITLIEWADRIQEILPEEYLLIEISRNEMTNPKTRFFKFIPKGQRYKQIMECLLKNDALQMRS
ncbi:MAG: tRNA threonylcarbamoyladenosine biosynthesis protein TsaE [Thermosediminibacterales bacterium]|nr:tRNA threonylcarbamoyladenosine biosynthesis protein TsaE [Thermosediminibacterales bacterium]MDK2835662.1 tRNA threonylcarbamoyladenosine biosynthesis protein TsaE [Thermosediminibacterales bacterium]